MDFNDTFYEIPLSPPPAIMAIGSSTLPKKIKTGERILVDYEIIFCVSGSGRFSSGDQTFSVNAGECIIVPPGLRHQYDPDPEKNKLYYLHFIPSETITVTNREEFTRKFLAMTNVEKASTKPLTIFRHSIMRLSTATVAAKLDTGILQQQLQGLFERAESAYLHQKPFCEMIVTSISVEIIAFLGTISINNYMGHQAIERNSSRLVADILSIIHKDFQDSSLEIRDVATALQVTPQHLSTLFRKEMGIPPGRYLQRVRIEHARKLLSSTWLSVKEIAAQSGVEDSNYFCRMFKASEGVSPDKWRERIP